MTLYVIIFIGKTVGSILLGLLKILGLILFCIIIYPTMIVTCLCSLGGYDEPQEILANCVDKVFDIFD